MSKQRDFLFTGGFWLLAIVVALVGWPISVIGHFKTIWPVLGIEALIALGALLVFGIFSAVLDARKASAKVAPAAAKPATHPAPTEAVVLAEVAEFNAQDPWARYCQRNAEPDKGEAMVARLNDRWPQWASRGGTGLRERASGRGPQARTSSSGTNFRPVDQKKIPTDTAVEENDSPTSSLSPAKIKESWCWDS